MRLNSHGKDHLFPPLAVHLSFASHAHSRVIITAVYKKTTMPELHFFNNCFQDEFSTREETLVFTLL